MIGRLIGDSNTSFMQNSGQKWPQVPLPWKLSVSSSPLSDSNLPNPWRFGSVFLPHPIKTRLRRLRSRRPWKILGPVPTKGWIGSLHPWKINGWNMTSWRFGRWSFSFLFMGPMAVGEPAVNLPGCRIGSPPMVLAGLPDPLGASWVGSEGVGVGVVPQAGILGWGRVRSHLPQVLAAHLFTE